ncbi:unnamed protein product [Soboliphyme baturini]|uniref:UDENN domain-containing protein n=1 Tax=Soboliphyme baturini TaxID=241478 RepID=A0A183J462_9BILA|nr:unnamed protein product [Soboliphyme baturini]
MSVQRSAGSTASLGAARRQHRAIGQMTGLGPNAYLADRPTANPFDIVYVGEGRPPQSGYSVQLHFPCNSASPCREVYALPKDIMGQLGKLDKFLSYLSEGMLPRFCLREEDNMTGKKSVAFRMSVFPGCCFESFVCMTDDEPMTDDLPSICLHSMPSFDGIY